jgi:hypothetical protein
MISRGCASDGAGNYFEGGFSTTISRRRRWGSGIFLCINVAAGAFKPGTLAGRRNGFDLGALPHLTARPAKRRQAIMNEHTTPYRRSARGRQQEAQKNLSQLSLGGHHWLHLRARLSVAASSLK